MLNWFLVSALTKRDRIEEITYFCHLNLKVANMIDQINMCYVLFTDEVVVPKHQLLNGKSEAP